MDSNTLTVERLYNRYLKAGTMNNGYPITATTGDPLSALDKK